MLFIYKDKELVFDGFFDLIGKARKIHAGGILAFHGDLEAAFSSDIPWDDMDMEMHDGLSCSLATVGEDIHAFRAKYAHFSLTDLSSDREDFRDDITWAGEKGIIMLLWQD